MIVFNVLVALMSVFYIAAAVNSGLSSRSFHPSVEEIRSKKRSKRADGLHHENLSFSLFLSFLFLFLC